MAQFTLEQEKWYDRAALLFISTSKRIFTPTVKPYGLLCQAAQIINIWFSSLLSKELVTVEQGLLDSSTMICH